MVRIPRNNCVRDYGREVKLPQLKGFFCLFKLQSALKGVRCLLGCVKGDWNLFVFRLHRSGCVRSQQLDDANLFILAARGGDRSPSQPNQNRVSLFVLFRYVSKAFECLVPSRVCGTPWHRRGLGATKGAGVSTPGRILICVVGGLTL